MKKPKIILYILLFSFLLVKVFYLFNQKGMLWDSAVYIGMGKFIYSFGEVGLWEPARPLVLPLFLGFFWRLGLDSIVFGSFLVVVFSVGCLCLTYLIGREAFNEKIGLLAAFLLAFSPSFLFYSSSVLTGIPSLFFALVSVYLLIRKRYFLCGLLVGLSFMTRFLQLFVLVPVVAYILFGRNRIMNLLKWGYGFSMMVVPYLVLNISLYKNPVFPFVFQVFMSRYTGWIYHGVFSFYLVGLLKENFLLLFSVVGAVLVLMKRNRKMMVVLGIFLVFFVFFNSIAHKEVRFILTFLPYMYILSAYGVFEVLSLVKRYGGMKGVVYLIIFVIGVVWLIQVSMQFSVPVYKEYGEFRGYLAKGVEGGLWISNPIFVVDSNLGVDELIYYPLYNSKRIDNLIENLDGAEYILIDTCDILPCPPSDKGCVGKSGGFLDMLKDRFELVYYNEEGGCEGFIFEKD